MADIVVNKYSTTDIDGLTAALDAKLNSVIDFTALANNSTSISKSSFAGKAGVTINYTDGNNKTMTLDNDMKDGMQYTIELNNTHSTTTILCTMPGAALSSTAKIIPVPNLSTVFLFVLWHLGRTRWVYRYGDSLVEVA